MKIQTAPSSFAMPSAKNSHARVLLQKPAGEPLSFQFMNCKARILIIEGQPAVLMMMVYLLTRAECDVTAVQSGTEAIKRAKREEFDLVIMDIDMPGANG